MKKIAFIILLTSGFALYSQNQSGTYLTSNCKKYKHPEIQFNVTNSTIPIEDIEWLKSTLEEQVSKGTKFKDGRTLQLGWMIVQFEKNSSGNLEIHEPNMADLPIRFENRIDNTLIHLRAQKDVLESINLKLTPEFPAITESILVHKNYANAVNVMMERTKAFPEISGWRVYDYDDEGAMDEDSFINISLYEFAMKRPDLIKFMALPEGMMVVKTPDQIQLYTKDNQQVAFRPGSFLDVLNSKRY